MAAAATTPAPYRALAIAIGDEHACVLRDDHSVKCWGRLVPDIGPGESLFAREIAAGGDDTCAILADGFVTCWSNRSPPFTPPAIDLGPGRTATHLAMRRGAVCAVLDDQSVHCSIGASHRVPPNGPPIRRLEVITAGELVALFEDGSLWDGYGTSFFSVAQKRVQALAISGCRDGTYCWCAAQAPSGVWCLGFGLQTLPDPSTTLTAIAIGGGFLCGTLPDGMVRCWGSLPGCDDKIAAATYWCTTPPRPDGSRDVALGLPALALASGSGFLPLMCALLTDGSVKCWGGGGTECVPHDDGTESCGAPEPSFHPAIIAAGVGISPAPDGNSWRYGPWHAVDLGSRK